MAKQGSAAAPQGVVESAPSHTPGPWRVEVARGVADGNGDMVAEVYATNGSANCALIAAAPDLLATLEDICSWFDDKPHHSGQATMQRRPAWAAVKAARDAISKAKGA